mmetsp:Transcript_112/g.359  ORF Transcript_112/g.359 Transcript_112/m.359 type:complete len:253 (-) Transcript_112:495-1253(-)
MSRIPLVITGTPACNASEVTPRPPCSTTASTAGNRAPKGTGRRSTRSRRSSASRSAASTSSTGAGSKPWPPTSAMTAGLCLSRGSPTGGMQCWQMSTATSSITRSPTGMEEKVMATTCRRSLRAVLTKPCTSSSSLSVPSRRKMKSVSESPFLEASSRPCSLRIAALKGTTNGTPCATSSSICGHVLLMSIGQGGRPLEVRSLSSCRPLGSRSMICCSTAENSRPVMSSRIGPDSSSMTLAGSARGSTSRDG